MQFNIIKRKKINHAGVINYHQARKYIISVCNGLWCIEDETHVGSFDEVTCKRCKKYVEEALLNDGNVTIKKKKSAKK
jgi:hypothetical protein